MDISQGLEISGLTVLLILASILLSAAAAYLAQRRWPFWTPAIILLLLLFHELAVKWLTFLAEWPGARVLAVSMWKDGATLGLTIGWGLELWRGKGDKPFASWIRELRPLDLALIVVILVGLLAVTLSPDRLAALAAFRDYYGPLPFFLIARAILPGRRELGVFYTWWLSAGTVLAAIGMWQTLFWDADDYVRFGFGQPISDLGVPPLELAGRFILRGPSTVSGPNELGVHMLLLIALGIMLFSLNSGWRSRFWLLLSGFFTGMLVLTYSRGDLLALPITVACILVIQWWKTEPGRGRLVASSAAVLVVALAVSLVTNMWDFMAGTATGLSADYHIIDTLEALERLAGQPQGIGMGLVGPRIGAFFPKEFAFHVEGSVFQIAFEMGVWGLLVWLVFVGLAVYRSAAEWVAGVDDFADTLSAVAVAGWVGSIVVQMFIPLMQSFTMMAWLWFLLGLACHRREIERAWAEPSAVMSDGPAAGSPG